MHIILATLGTDGDIVPHLGLGAVLRGRGHQITLAAPETYRDRARLLGLEFVPLVTTAEVERMLADPDLWHPLRSGLMMSRWGGSMIHRQYTTLAELAQVPGSVIVANPGVLAARLVQEKLGCPTATLLLQPGLLPSCTSPPKMPGGLNIPRWFPQPLRKLYWMGVDTAGYFLVCPSLNRVRASLGMAPVRWLFRWWLSPDMVIGLFPDWYAAPQPDWPPQLRLAGFSQFDGAQSELPDDIAEFCRVGSPPVAFTLGTGMMHASTFFREAVATCESMGVRGLLLTKFADLIPSQLPSTILHCTFAPFHKLLPHCAAVVHHGGVGTTAAALAAACPQLVLPLAWDQPDNAARVTRLGVGTSLGSWRRTGRHMARALAGLMTPEVRSRCQSVTAQTASQNGLQTAASLVETLGNKAART